MNEIVTPPREDALPLRQELIRAGLRLCELGFFIGTWGNISVRVTDGVLITPTRMDYDAIQPDDLVVVSWTGERLRGHRLPSSETLLHRTLLQARPDLGAIIHSHPRWCSSVACARLSIPCIAEDMAHIIGGEVKCSPYLPGAHHAELARAVCEVIGDEVTAVLLANHGVVVGGRDLKEALVATQVLEKAAMTYIQASALGGVVPIPRAQAQAERHRYLFTYGTAADMNGSAAK